jgi:hypothetical protein
MATNNFSGILKQLLDTVTEAWPELESVRNICNTVPKDQLTSKFHEHFQHLYRKAMTKDITLFQDPVFEAYGVQQKLTECTPETMKILWDYIEHLVRFATMDNMYRGIPSNIMRIISGAVGTVKERMDNGTMDESMLNPLKLGQDVMSKVSADEVEQMTQQLLSNEQQVSNMLNSMQILLEGMGPGMPNGDMLSGLLESLNPKKNKFECINYFKKENARIILIHLSFLTFVLYKRHPLIVVVEDLDNDVGQVPFQFVVP